MAGFLDTLFGGGAEREAAERNRQATQLYQGQSLDALKGAYGEGTGYLKEGISAYDPLVALGQKYSGAGDVWMNALGVNGPQGSADATSAFQATPGWALTSKVIDDANARRGALTGMYRSGNTDLDLMERINKGFYDTQYAPWMQGLQSAAQMGGQYTTAGAAGQAGGFTNLANLAQQYGQSQTGVYGNTLSSNMDSNKLEAAGAAQGAKNFLGAGLSLASMAVPGGGSLAGMLAKPLLEGGGNMIGSMMAPPGGFTGFTSFGR